MAHAFGKWVLRAGIAMIVWLAMTPAASASPIFWTDWQAGDGCAGACFTGTGTITTTTSTVTVTYNNANGVGFFQTGAGGETDYWRNGTFGSGGRNDAISPYTSSAVDNSPPGTDIVALQFQGAQTLTFSQTIANPVFAFVSLNGNGYRFVNQDFEILSVGGVDGNACGYWGCGGVVKEIVPVGGNTEYRLNASNVGGTEPHGVIRFLGAFDTLTWNSQTNEFWNGFTVGVQGTASEVFPEQPPVAAVPEPTTLVLLGSGLAAAALRRRRRS